jgi:uncharacterized protein YjiS (DUF1127 family)
MGPQHEAAALGRGRATTTAYEEACVEFQWQAAEGAPAHAAFQAEGEEAAAFAPRRAVEAGAQVERPEVSRAGEAHEAERLIARQAQSLRAKRGAELEDLGITRKERRSCEDREYGG